MSGRDGKEKAPADAGAVRRAPRQPIKALPRFTYQEAKEAFEAWKDAEWERLGSPSIMWDPETDELLPVGIGGYREFPKRDQLAAAIRAGTSVDERDIDQVVSDYEAGGPPPPPEVVRFLASRGRGKGQSRPGAPKGTRAQVMHEGDTRNRFQVVRWYLKHRFDYGHDAAHRAAKEWMAQTFGMDPRTVQKRLNI